MRNNTIIRNTIFALAFTFIFGAVGAAESRGQAVMKEILDRMDMNNKTLSSLRSDIKMDKTDNNLGETDTNTGSVSYLPKSGKRSMYVRIDWRKPEENMVVIGNDYKIYRRGLNQVIVGKTDSAKTNGKAGNALAFISMSREQLKAAYDVSYVGQEQISGAIQTWHILLTPKGKSSYKSADLWVDKDGMPRQARVLENNGDTTTVLLSGIQKNTKIDAKVFALDIPKTAKVVKA